MLLGFNDSECFAYTVDSARGLIVIGTYLVLASGKLVLQKNFLGSIFFLVVLNYFFHLKQNVGCGERFF